MALFFYPSIYERCIAQYKCKKEGDYAENKYVRGKMILPPHGKILNPDGRAIVKLCDHGYAAVGGNEKKDNAYINVADFAVSHLKFDLYGKFKKVKDDSEIDAKIIENIKYTLKHAAGTYGVLHPGLKIDGIE